MALYAFDGTWNSDEDQPEVDTNVVRFTELYKGTQVEYVAGVGTRFGKLGAALGGLFGTGGRTRIAEMYDELCENWRQGDRVIDIVGFSRGAALAVHFANLIGEKGIRTNGDHFDKAAKVRFVGVWDIVGSFGLSFDTIVNFQEINLGWNIDTLDVCVEHCYHAMALDERRETFNVTRLDPDHNCPGIHEVWFRGVHSDVGGGNGNEARSNIALQWMLDKARSCGVEFDETKAAHPRYRRVDRFAPVSQNKDVKRDPRRTVLAADQVDPSAQPMELGVGDSHTCLVSSKDLYNWCGVRVHAGETYQCTVADGARWKDGDIECGPEGWSSDDLPAIQRGIVRFAERFRRIADANWFALIATLGDEDDDAIVLNGTQTSFSPQATADLYMFANDMSSKYGNNEGALSVTVTRTA